MNVVDREVPRAASLDRPPDVPAAPRPPQERKAKLRPLVGSCPISRATAGRRAAALIALVVAAVTTLVVPIAVRRMIDFGFSRDSVNLIDSYFTVLIAVVAVLALASAARFYLVTMLGERIVADLRSEVFAHLTSLSAAYFDQAKTGEMISRLTADTTQIKAAVGSAVSVALRNIVLFLGATAMMVITSPRLSAFVLAAIPVIVLPLYGFGRAVRARSRAAQDTLAAASAYASELIGAIRVLQAFTNEKLAHGRFAAAVERAFHAAVASTRARAILTAIAIFLVFASVVVVLWVGAQDVLAGRITAGRLSQFVLYAVFAAAGLGQLSEVWGELSHAAGAAERLFEILNIKPVIVAPAHPVALPRAGARRGRVRRCPLRLSDAARIAGARWRIAAGAARREGCDRGAVGRRQEHDLPPDPAILRSAVGHRHATTARRSPPSIRSALRRHIALVPQDAVDLCRVDRRQHPLRPAGGERRRGRARGRACARVRVHRAAAGEVSDAGRRARRDAVRRPAPAHRDRARDPARCAAAAAR